MKEPIDYLILIMDEFGRNTPNEFMQVYKINEVINKVNKIEEKFDKLLKLLEIELKDRKDEQ